MRLTFLCPRVSLAFFASLVFVLLVVLSSCQPNIQYEPEASSAKAVEQSGVIKKTGAEELSEETEVRLGLVIHQNRYSGNLSKLPGTPREAALISDALSKIGFNVTVASDLDKSELQAEIRRFRRTLEAAGPNAVGFIYYTGHGAQNPRNGSSYLLAIDADIEVASDLIEYGVSLSDVSEQFSSLGNKGIYLVFDACRNPPGSQDFKATVKGLSAVGVYHNMLVAYATDLGALAEEGTFAPILAEELVRPGQSSQTAFSETQTRVAERTGFRQKPWTNNKIYNRICFAGCEAANSTPISANDVGASLGDWSVSAANFGSSKFQAATHTIAELAKNGEEVFAIDRATQLLMSSDLSEQERAFALMVRGRLRSSPRGNDLVGGMEDLEALVTLLERSEDHQMKFQTLLRLGKHREAFDLFQSGDFEVSSDAVDTLYRLGYLCPDEGGTSTTNKIVYSEAYDGNFIPCSF